MRNIGRRLAATVTLDPLSLAIGRMALAAVLLLDLGRRAAQLTLWYSNEGLLPNHTVLWRPSFPRSFSLFYAASTPAEAGVVFGACAVAYLMLLVGYRTRLAQIASVLCVLSLHGRVLFLQNGGDVVLSELALWTAFLPSGLRLSLDARAGAAAQGPDQDRAQQPVCSPAVFALLLQLVLIYAFNAVHKTGATWRAGTVVHYVLHQDHMVTRLGLWARGHLPLRASQVMTWSALAIEALLPVLLLSPVAVRQCRRLAVLLIVTLHAGFGSFLNLGLFVPAMIAFGVHFVPARDWAALLAWAHIPAPVTPAAPAARRRPVYLRVAGPALLGAMVTVAASQMLTENGAVRRVVQIAQPRWMQWAVDYLQLFQGWSMFAPDAPTGDFGIYVDAVTADGRHVDPLNEVANPRYPAPGASIPARLDQSWLFCDYIARLPTRPEYLQAFTEWILRYGERSGRPQDAVSSFKAFVVEDDSPPPGASPGNQSPFNTRLRPLVAYPPELPPAVCPAVGMLR